VGYNIYKSTHKKPAAADQTTQVDPNDVDDGNNTTIQEER
jgi:hypothetical protein